MQGNSQEHQTLIDPYQRSPPPRASGTGLMNVIWFAAALCLVAVGIMGVVATLISFKIADCIEMLYLVIFGSILAVLDTPIFANIKIVPDLKKTISQYVSILTRVTGRGMVFVFLGCTMWASVTVNVDLLFLKIIAALLTWFTIIVGIGSVGIGLSKSWKAERVRTHFLSAPPNTNIEAMYSANAKLQPNAGMTKEEFGIVVKNVRGMLLSNADLQHIFHCICTDRRREYLSKKDMEDWVHGGLMVFL